MTTINIATCTKNYVVAHKLVDMLLSSKSKKLKIVQLAVSILLDMARLEQDRFEYV